jgi:hypothetical protein
MSFTWAIGVLCDASAERDSSSLDTREGPFDPLLRLIRKPEEIRHCQHLMC